MTRQPIIFMIFAPNDLNEEVVTKAAYLEHHLEMEFPGYQFQVADLSQLKPVKAGAKVQFGDGLSFAIVPLLGQTSDGVSSGYVNEVPSQDLVADIADACQRFDLANPQRYAA